MATYYQISLKEMEDFLTPQGFVLVPVEGCREKVFSRLVGKATCLRVFTGIEGLSSRGVGKDAIRVSLVTKTPEGEIKGVGHSKRVHRVEGWRNNLQARLDDWKELEGEPCPYCGTMMAHRKGKNGKFWGCVRYPVCRGTRSIEEK